MPLRFDPAALNAPGGILHGLDDLGAAVVNALNRKAERANTEQERERARTEAAALRAAERQFQLDRDEVAYKRKLQEIESEQTFKSSEAEKERKSREGIAAGRNAASLRNAMLRHNALAGAASVPKDVIRQAYSAAGTEQDGRNAEIVTDVAGVRTTVRPPWSPDQHAKFEKFLNDWRAKNQRPPMSLDEVQSLRAITSDSDDGDTGAPAPAPAGAAPIPNPAAPSAAAPQAGGDWKAAALAQLDAKLAAVAPDKRPAAEAKAATIRAHINAAASPDALQSIPGVRVNTPAAQPTIQFTPEQMQRLRAPKPTQSPAADTPLGFTPDPYMSDAQYQLLTAYNEANRAAGHPAGMGAQAPDFQRAVAEAQQRLNMAAAPAPGPQSMLQQIQDARRLRSPFIGPPMPAQGMPDPFALQELQ